MSGQPRAAGRTGGAAAGGAPRASKPAASARYTPADTADAPAKGNEKLAEVQKKADAVKAVMTENMNKTLARGKELEEIESKSDDLLRDAKTFEDLSGQTRKMFCRRNLRNALIIAAVVALFLGLIIWWATK